MDLAELNEIIGKVQSLVNTIRVVRSRIEKSRATYSGNETNTKNGLINPVLGELGWDVTDPELVWAEYSMQGGRVDYALMRDGSPIAVIEAKKLGTGLGADATAQVLNYVSNDQAVKYAIATNGDSWRMQVRGERTLAVNVILTKRPEYESALELMKISRSVMPPNSVVQDSEPIPNAPSHAESEPLNWLTFDELEFKGKSPNFMMLPDGKQVTISSWKGIWLVIAEWITSKHPVHGEVLFGKNPNYMAIRTENEGFWNGFGEQLSNGYWVIGGTLNPRNARRASRALLEHYDVDKNSFRFRFDNSP